MLFRTKLILNTKNNTLAPRRGNLTFDSSVHYEEPQKRGVEYAEDLGPIHVEAGLIRSDFVVFLGRVSSSERKRTEEAVPYFVTYVNEAEDGEGILVATDLVGSDPETWLSDHVVQRAGDIPLEDLAIQDIAVSAALDAVFRSRNLS
jgi:hypothetical protein